MSNLLTNEEKNKAKRAKRFKDAHKAEETWRTKSDVSRQSTEDVLMNEDSLEEAKDKLNSQND